jgi:gas vesicle structural protein
MTTAVQPASAGSGGALERPTGSGLAEVIDSILDKGLVIDVYVRASLVGIELLTVDARVVVASVETYLRFAEAANRVNIADDGTKGLPEFLEGAQEKGAQKKVKGAARGALEGAADAARSLVGPGERSRSSPERER